MMARQVLAAYLRDNGLSADACKEFSGNVFSDDYMAPAQCDVLRSAMADGAIAGPDENALREMKFSDEFISEISLINRQRGMATAEPLYAQNYNPPKKSSQSNSPGSGINQNQAGLAEMAIEFNATDDGISEVECQKLEQGTMPDVFLSAEQCAAVRSALGSGRDAIVTDEEAISLRKAGLSNSFVAVIQGPDGKNSLRIRMSRQSELLMLANMRTAVIDEYGQIGPDAADAVPAILSVMEQGDGKTVIACARALGRIGVADKAVIDALKKRKKSSNPEVRKAAADALKQIANPSAIPAEETSPAAESTEVEVQPAPPSPQPEHAADPLGKHSMPELLAALANSDAEIADRAKQELMSMKVKPLISELKKAISHKDPVVRMKAISALGKMGAKAADAAPKIAAALEDESLDVKKEALFALIELGADAAKAVPLLSRLISAADERVALAAINVLKRMGHAAAAAIPGLAKAAFGDDPKKAQAAKGALAEIVAASDISKLLKTGDSPTRIWAFGWMREHPEEAGAAATAAARLLKDPDMSVRKEALLMLYGIGPEAAPAIEILRNYLSSDDEALRKAAAFILGMIGPNAKKALKALSKIAEKDPSQGVRQKAKEAIAKIDPEAVQPEATPPAPATPAAPSAPATPAPQAPTAPAPQPTPAAKLSGRKTTPEILSLVNQARATGRTCGDKGYFPPVPPIAWNEALAQAALAHSTDMAAKAYFEHKGKDGKRVGSRVSATGYNWSNVGENIALGQTSVRDAMEAWLKSPLHCENIMSPKFEEIGVAYAYGTDLPKKITDKGGSFINPIYWTMVFGTKQ